MPALDDRLKRCFDVLAAAAGLGLSAPLLVLIATSIRLTMGKPIFFSQSRIGWRGRAFEILKFRTMVPDAEALAPDRQTRTGDPRITALGSLLRNTSLDELPQLFNILRGDMSVVGPRPALLRDLDEYTDEQRRRLELRPGLTGWAQINGNTLLSWPERIAHDLWYVDHRSLALDLRILLRTFGVVARNDK